MTLNEIVKEIQDGIASGRFTGYETLICEDMEDDAEVETIVHTGKGRVRIVPGSRL